MMTLTDMPSKATSVTTRRIPKVAVRYAGPKMRGAS